MKGRCAVPQRVIKSKGNSLIKKKERYAVLQGGQINLYGNSLLKFVRQEKEKEKERKKENKKERKEKKKKRKEKKRMKERKPKWKKQKKK